MTTPSDTNATETQATQNPYQYQSGATAPNYPPPPGAKPGSSGLFVGSVICSVIGLFILPIILCPVGAVLGFVDYSRGDRKGLWAGIGGIVALVVGLLLGVAVFKATHH